MADKPPPHVTVGVLGWGNRKSGLEAYGEGGRWHGDRNGDLLGDALEREGQHEGARLIVVSLPRFCPVPVEELKEHIEALVGGWFDHLVNPKPCGNGERCMTPDCPEHG